MSTGNGHISAVGIGSGARQMLTEQASAAINAVDVVVGYKPYCEAIGDIRNGRVIVGVDR